MSFYQSLNDLNPLFRGTKNKNIKQGDMRSLMAKNEDGKY